MLDEIRTWKIIVNQKLTNFMLSLNLCSTDSLD
jgi:hypothetical protein